MTHRAPDSDSVEIPGYTLAEELGRGAHSVVYRALRGERGYALKIGRVARGDDRRDAVRRLLREGAILACLRHPALPIILETGEVDGRAYIVQELVQGEPLAQLLEGGAMAEADIVPLAVRLAGALAEVHRWDLVHCDVKPANIIVGDAGARLIDFGLATRSTAAVLRDEIAGTLLYASPEQTGMLKRPLDGRSDLYSLGVVLFECATGAPPFADADAGELVRRHTVAAVPDVRQRNPQISRALAAIIHKLLAKDPDDRYPSGHALVADVERLPELEEELEAGAAASLGLRGSGALLSRRQTLIGRQDELARLSRSWERAPRRGQIALIEGQAGLGKTQLVRELAGRALEQGLPALVASCSEDKPLPFGALRGAVEDLLRWRNELPAAQRQRLDGWLRVAVGDAGGLLGRFSPGLVAAAGGGLAEQPLEGVEDQFYDALADFFARLAREAGRLMLVVEEVGWLDDGSRTVLARLLPQIRQLPLLLIVTARADGRDGRDGADSFGLGSGASIASRLSLAPLDDASIRRLVAAQLGDEELDLPLLGRIAERCDGRPFVAVEYVRSMVDAGLLRPAWGRWEVDESALDELDLPTDVVKLVVRRLAGLSESTREVLTFAAVVGAGFELALLVAVTERDTKEVLAAVVEALAARVLQRAERGEYAFVHASLRAELYDALSEERARGLHQRVAEAIDASGGRDDERVYALARHYARGQLADDARPAFETGVAAARRALADYAHDDAHDFLMSARQCAEVGGIELDRGFHRLVGEASAVTGRLGEAIDSFEAALAGEDHPLARGALRERLAHAHIANFHTRPCWREVRAGLADLGRPMARWRPLRGLGAAWCWVRGVLSRWLRVGFGSATGERRLLWSAFGRLTEQGAIGAYFASRPGELLQLVMRGLYAATRLGPSPELVTSYCQHAVGFSLVGLHRRARRNIERAEALAAELGDRLTIARCSLYRGFVAHLCHSPLEAQAILTRALEEHGTWLDALHFVDGSGDLVFNLVLRGYFREAWVWIDRQLTRLWFTSGGVGEKQGNPWAGPVLAALGRATEAVHYQEKTQNFVEAAPRSETFMWGELLSNRVLYLLEQGDVGPELDRAIAERRELGLSPRWTTFHMRGFYVYQAYARAEQAQRAEGDERRTRLRQLKSALRELRKGITVPSMTAHARVLEGTRLRLLGKHRKAQRALSRAARLAREIDSPWVLYEVARQRAHLLSERGMAQPARREAQLALGIALEQRWVHRARRIRTAFGLSSTAGLTQTDHGSTLGTRDTGGTGSLKLRRQLDALMQVSLAAATVLDPVRYAATALDEVVRILGAERAFLFECRDAHQLDFLAGRDSRGEDLDQPTGFSTTVVETVRVEGEPVVVSGTEDGPAIGSASVVTHDLRSIAAAPLSVRDRVVGVLYLDNRLARGVFTEDDLDILMAIGNHIAIALETARTAQLEIRVEAESQKRRLAESLRDFSHALSETLVLDEVVARLLDGVSGVVPMDRAAVFLRGEDGAFRESLARGSEEAADTELSPLLAEVAEARAPLVLRDTVREGRGPRRRGEREVRSWMGVPLISQHRVAGVLALESHAPQTYSAGEAEIAFTFAGQTGIAIENARLFAEVRRLATTDELTGTLNRRQFFVLAERCFARARQEGTLLAAIMLDIDHFKRVNDDFGHLVGDQVLAEVARRVRECLDDGAVLGRYGGEEFAIVAPGVDRETAAAGLAERIRAAVRGAPVSSERGEVRVTASLGVADLGTRIEELSALLDEADGALYRAKEGGRDRVVIS